MKVNFDLYNFTVIDFTETLYSDIVIDWIDYLHEYSLVEASKKTKTRIFYHFFIKRVCDSVIESKSSLRKAFFLQLSPKNIDISRIDGLFSEISMQKTDFFRIIINLIQLLRRNFPIRFVVSTISFEKYIDSLRSNEGKLNKFRLSIEQKDTSKVTFSKINKFAKKYDLIWLDKNYFTNIKTKLLIVS